MLEIAMAFVRDNWVIISVFIVNEIIALNPKWFSGSIGQLVINMLRSALSKPPVGISTPAPK